MEPLRPIAAVYCRISADDLRSGEGVENQEAECRKLADRLGYRIGATYVENDVSASTRSKKPRPQYDELMERARRGEYAAVLAYSTSRLTRRPREFEDLLELVEQGVAIRTASGDVDLSTAMGRQMARHMANFDASEPDFISERVALAAVGRARRGKAHGPLAYGWDRVDGRNVVNPEQAAVLREVAERALAGEGLGTIARDFNRRGVALPSARPWDGSRVRRLLLRPANAGTWIYQPRNGGEPIVSHSDETIWDDGTQAQLEALLRDPSRRTSRGNELSHFLSGILRCGGEGREGCTGRIKGNAGKPYRAKDGTEKRWSNTYRCPVCRGVAGPEKEVDAAVTALVLNRLSAEDGPTLMVRDESAARTAQENISGWRARLDTAADDYADGAIDREQLRRISERLRGRIAEAERELAANAPSPALAAFTADAQRATIEEAWEAASLEVRRAIVEQLMTLTLLPAERRTTRWSSERLRVDWKRSLSTSS